MGDQLVWVIPLSLTTALIGAVSPYRGDTPLGSRTPLVRALAWSMFGLAIGAMAFLAIP